MSKQPPSPERPSAGPTTLSLPTDSTREERVLATTGQLATVLEDTTGLAVDTDVLEELLVELDQRGYIDWVDIAPTGEYLWDLTDSPEKIADAVAAAVAARIAEWAAED